MKVVGEIFELTDRWGRGTPASMATAVGPVLIVSVAKRWVRSAVRRNVMRRIAREAWTAGRPIGVEAPDVRWLLKVRTNPFADPSASPRPGARTPSLPATHRAARAAIRADADRVLAKAWARRSPTSNRGARPA